MRLKRDGTRAETRFRLSPKRTSPFKSSGASVQSTAGSRGVRISGSNAGYTPFRSSVRVLATHFIRQFPFHFPTRASPCAIRFQTHSTTVIIYRFVVQLFENCEATFFWRTESCLFRFLNQCDNWGRIIPSPTPPQLSLFSDSVT